MNECEVLVHNFFDDQLHNVRVLQHLRLPHFPANKWTNSDQYKPVTKPVFAQSLTLGELSQELSALP